MTFALARYLGKPTPQVQPNEIPGTLCPRAVDDVQTWLLFEKKNENVYCVGSLSRDKYLAVPASKLAMTQEIIALFDGKHSLDEIQRHYYESRYLDVDVKQLYTLLLDAGLLDYPQSERIFESEFKRLSLQLAAVNLTRLYPSAVSETAVRLVIGSSLAIILAGLLVVPRDILWSNRYYQFANSYSVGFVVLAFGLLFGILIHELSHGWVATWYGLKPKQLKVALYLGFMMFFYMEIPGIYTVKPFNRIKIWMAGIYANLFLGCLLLLARQLFTGSSWHDDLVLKLALANFLMVAMNLLPFVPTDGYFIMSTLAKVTNLRTNALGEFVNLLRRQEAKLSLPIVAYSILSVFVVLNAFLMQVRWLWKMIQRLYLESPTQSPEEYVFTLVLVLLFVLAPPFAWFQRRRWSARLSTPKT